MADLKMIVGRKLNSTVSIVVDEYISSRLKSITVFRFNDGSNTYTTLNVDPTLETDAIINQTSTAYDVSPRFYPKDGINITEFTDDIELVLDGAFNLGGEGDNNEYIKNNQKPYGINVGATQFNFRTGSFYPNDTYARIDTSDVMTRIGNFTEQGNFIFRIQKKQPKGVYVTRNIANCDTNAPETIIEGGEYSFDVEANAGYEIQETPSFAYTDSNGDSVEVTPSLNDGLYTFSFTVGTLSEDNAVLNATAVRIPQSAVFDYSGLSNCEVSPKFVDAVESTNSFEMIITADSGYEFKNIPKISFVTADGNKDFEFVMNEYNTQGTIDFGVDSANGVFEPLDDTEITFSNCVATKVETFYCEVVNEIENCSLTFNGDNIEITQIENGSTFEIVATADNGFEFNGDRYEESVAEFEYTDGSGNTKILDWSGDRSVPKKIHLGISNISLEKGSKVYIRLKPYSLGGATVNYDNIVNCSVTPKPTEYRNGTRLELTFKAKDGYYFNSTPYLNGFFVGFTQPQTITGYLNDDKTVATLLIDTSESGVGYNAPVIDGSVITVVATAVSETLQYNLSTVFLPSDKNIYELSKARYYKYSEGGTFVELWDLGQYILSLRKIFVDLPQSDQQQILLGFYQSGIIAPTFEGYEYTVSCGVRKIVGMYENSLDFTNAIIELSLPFIGLQTLDATKVMNRTIEIVYKINVVEGLCFAEVVDVDDNTVLYTFDGVCAINIPYILERGDALRMAQMIKGELSVDNKSMYKELPKLTIRQRDVVDNENLYGDNTQAFTLLSELQGFAIVENARLDGIDCNDDERTMILQALAQGCFF